MPVWGIRHVYMQPLKPMSVRSRSQSRGCLLGQKTWGRVGAWEGRAAMVPESPGSSPGPGDRVPQDPSHVPPPTSVP